MKNYFWWNPILYEYLGEMIWWKEFPERIDKIPTYWDCPRLVLQNRFFSLKFQALWGIIFPNFYWKYFNLWLFLVLLEPRISFTFSHKFSFARNFLNQVLEKLQKISFGVKWDLKKIFPDVLFLKICLRYALWKIYYLCLLTSTFFFQDGKTSKKPGILDFKGQIPEKKSEPWMKNPKKIKVIFHRKRFFFSFFDKEIFRPDFEHLRAFKKRRFFFQIFLEGFSNKMNFWNSQKSLENLQKIIVFAICKNSEMHEFRDFMGTCFAK